MLPGSRVEGLAPAVVLELFHVFDALRQHISIVIVEHNLDLVLALADRCSFEVAEFLEYDARGERFDVVLGMGYFDYVEDAVPHLRKMAELCKGRVFASFPKRWEWRVPVRRLRFALHGGYVRFYSRGQVEALPKACGLAEERAAIIDLGRDYLLVLRTS